MGDGEKKQDAPWLRQDPRTKNRRERARAIRKQNEATKRR